MRYLVNRETKEHIRYHEGSCLPLAGWDIVQADSEGWIQWNGGECPLPDGRLFDVRLRNGKSRSLWHPGVLSWNYAGLDSGYHPVAYRPVFAKAKAKEQEQQCNDLLALLKAAHESAVLIPDLEAELRAVLEPLGYDLVRRDPFVESLGTEPLGTEFEKALVNNMAKLYDDDEPDEPAEDMTDWRNWREGDLVECVRGGDGSKYFPDGAKLRVGTDDSGDFGVLDTEGDVWAMSCFTRPEFCPDIFRWHSRPGKEE